MKIFNFDKKKLEEISVLYLNNKPIFLAIIKIKEVALFNFLFILSISNNGF